MWNRLPLCPVADERTTDLGLTADLGPADDFGATLLLADDLIEFDLLETDDLATADLIRVDLGADDLTEPDLLEEVALATEDLGNGESFLLSVLNGKAGRTGKLTGAWCVQKWTLE